MSIRTGGTGCTEASSPYITDNRRAMRCQSSIHRSSLSLIVMLIVLGSAPLEAAELLGGRVGSGANPVLHGAGTGVRLEQARVGATDVPTFYVPEPGVHRPLGLGVALAMFMSTRLRRATVARRRVGL